MTKIERCRPQHVLRRAACANCDSSSSVLCTAWGLNGYCT